MSKRFFTREQIEQLSSNENVVRVGKTIVYSKDFKIKAVKLYNKQGLTSKEIFRQAGFKCYRQAKAKGLPPDLEQNLQTKRRKRTQN